MSYVSNMKQMISSGVVNMGMNKSIWHALCNRLINVTTLTLLSVFLLTGAMTAYGQQQPKQSQEQDTAASLDQLLDFVRQGRIKQSQENKTREKQFEQQKRRQEQLLKEMKEERVRQEELSARLEAEYENNDGIIVLKEQQLLERKGDLTELFGHLTAATGDLIGQFEFSLSSVQYPERKIFLESLLDKINAQSDQLPEIEEIERMWWMMQQEIIESGRVVRFPHKIVKPDGTELNEKVVRIGSYNVISAEGRYLKYDANKQKLEELARQPARNLLNQARELVGSNSGFTKVGIDPTGPSGGSYLAALINSPTIEERWHQGGVIGYFITGLGAFALLLALWRLLYLGLEGMRVRLQMGNRDKLGKNALGKVLTAYRDNSDASGEVLEAYLEEAILKEVPRLESGHALLKIIAAVAPLMGLLGTVTGMIITFQQITIFGAGDPKAMAGGISTALVTTVLGLCVAIPTVLLHTLVHGRSKGIIQVIEEESLGLVAKHGHQATENQTAPSENPA